MTKKLIVVSLIFLVVSSGLFILLLYTSKEMARYEKTVSDVGILGVLIEEFKSDHGRYPSSISDLESNADVAEKERIAEIIQNSWNNQYEFLPSNDGVQINVKGYHFLCHAIVNGIEIKGDFSTNSITTTIR